MGVIYKITNIINSKIYIGQTIQIFNKRVIQYKYDCKRFQSLICKAINKHGYNNFLFEKIETVDDLELDSREKFWIEYYQSSNKLLGYNQENGGRRGNCISEELRKKMSDNHASKKEDYIAPNKGKIFNEQWKENMRKKKTLSKKQRDIISERMREVNLGRKNTEEHNNKIAESKHKSIDQFSLDNVFIKNWNSVKEISKFYETSSSNISEVLTGKQKSAKGFLWRYHND